MDADLCFAPATEIRQRIADKEVSIAELVELFYQRIEAIDPNLNAYLTLSSDEALGNSQRIATSGAARGTPGAVARRPHIHKGLGVDQGSSHHYGLGGFPGPGPGY